MFNYQDILSVLKNSRSYFFTVNVKYIKYIQFYNEIQIQPAIIS